MPVQKTQQIGRLIVVFVMAIIVACTWLSPFDSKANEQVDAGLKRATATYATARLLNGVISVVQGTEITATPVGIGVVFTPGQVLDPINDLVEQFSQVMLVAMVAFGVEKVLLAVGKSWMISVALSLIAAAWSTLYLLRMTCPPWLGRLLLVLLLTRFGMPLALMGTEEVFQHFMAADYQESQIALQQLQSEASRLGGAPQESVDKPGFWDKIKSATVDSVSDARSRLDRLKNTAETAVERVIKLMVIFVLETIIFPILFIWLLLQGVRGSMQTTTAPISRHRNES